MDSLNDLNERVDAFVGTSSFETPAATNDQAPIDVPAEVHEDIVASVDFSEVELADEFTEPQVAVTPNGLLPMEPLPIDGRLRKAALRMPDEIEEPAALRSLVAASNRSSTPPTWRSSATPMPTPCLPSTPSRRSPPITQRC